MIDEDAQLMLAFAAGDRSAFDELFRRYTPRVLNFLARMIKDRARAEELCQDVFVRIYNARERYEARTKFSTYLFAIAHNLALNDLDRAYRKREKAVESFETLDSADPTPDAADQLEALRTGEAIATAMAGLPERQRAALLLRAEQGMAYGEIAEALGTSVSGVKSMIHRARQNLWVALKEVRT